ncbi:molybdenum cofactor biosynthesis protein B [Microbulbifer litoralis]|uniref:molybdenum cofactor biosynthesis protein B n=1 Tax=Microbulbifer litoralis TaxID=2933965 RepID=UPI0020278941|nr:molybdenum cofactor biosynthesis protein B [Microbulbifer sp. GX H0434]
MQDRENNALSIAVLTVSDTRTEDTDTSGQYLAEVLQSAGHTLHEKKIVRDDIYQLRAEVSRWIADDNVQVILTTGGTGFSGRDSTPEALAPLFDKRVEGFGELFRAISYDEIGSSTIQSRALAGLANNTLVCCMPGSTGACRTAWENILGQQLDAAFKPCNFVAHLRGK